MRLAEPSKHLEAITSRPSPLSAIAERSRHARQTTLRVASSHAKAGLAASVLSDIARFLGELTQNAEQFTAHQRWRRNPLPCCAILARWPTTARSATPYGAGMTGRTHINRLRGRCEITLRRGQLPNYGVLGDHHWEAGTEHFFRLAREAGKLAILDADRQTSMGILASATHIGFSARGLREQSGMESLPDALAWCQTQVQGWLAVTDGANGALFTEQGSIAHDPALKVFAVDTNGAGDVWHGALAVALLEGQEPRKAVRFANAAASIKCSRGGGRSAIPGRSEVSAFL